MPKVAQWIEPGTRDAMTLLGQDGGATVHEAQWRLEAEEATWAWLALGALGVGRHDMRGRLAEKGLRHV